jgi:hypothetical protein
MPAYARRLRARRDARPVVAIQPSSRGFDASALEEATVPTGLGDQMGADEPLALDPPRVSVVIPTLNEAKNIPHVFARLPSDVYEIVLVDGNSADGTVEVARELYPEVRIVGQPGRGKGDALAAGFAAARGDIIVMIDADGSQRPEEIPSYVAALTAGADFAKGSRFMEGGGSADITALRRAGNRVLTFLANRLHGSRYTDLCYGYNAFWASCLPHMDVDCSGFEVETLINVRIARAGLAVTEIPSFEDCRLHGESNLNTFRDGFRVLRTLWRERRRMPVATLRPDGGSAAAGRRHRAGPTGAPPRRPPTTGRARWPGPRVRP